MTATCPLSKASVISALRARLEHDLQVAVQAHQRTQSGVTHEESRPENDKDTRAIEASYLARGQAQRVVELEGALATVAALEPREFGVDAGIALSALVRLDDGDRSCWFFLAPGGGGMELDVDAVKVKVLTPQSPLGRALLGRKVGESIDFQTPQALREYSVLDVV